MPGRHQRQIFAPPIGTATPNTVYTQQAAKPACQEDTNAKCSHLLLAQLPRTTFTHSKLPNPHARKTPTQNFRTSYWHSYPEHSLHTARRQTRTPGRHQCNMFASPIGRATPNDIYTQHIIYTQQAAKPFLEAPKTAPATQTAAAAQQPFLEVPGTAPATQTGTAATRRAATLSGGSKYCACHANTNRGPRRPGRSRGPRQPGAPAGKYSACHADRSRGPRQPGAPQLFLEAPSTAPATRPGAPPPILEAPSTARKQEPRPTATRRAATLCGSLPRRQEPRPTATRRAKRPPATQQEPLSEGSKYCACHTDRSHGPRPTRRAATLSRGSEMMR